MRVSLDPRARRMLRRIPHTTVYSGIELLLLFLLAMQCARFVWTLVTPVGPVGNWRAATTFQPPRPVAPDALALFDPFFRLTGSGAPLQVTSLNIKLFGVREDRASGRGSAIIGLPDGQQQSFAVGDEIVPGVKLVSVEFDGITISRNGANEQLFLDQSSPANVVSGGNGPAQGPMPQILPPGAAPAPANMTPQTAPQSQPPATAPPRTGWAAGPLTSNSSATSARKTP